ncbi:hypothetical protein Bca52824_032970 [Brassica carinata]|uniref:Uncharacterized protein n=1 Tax=Brassica carinata TaxID=52824 RepID=A0A8X7V6P1_BRACI|nr:hypothetical protein Bca52824_032970 [Brassica carinata]
MIDVIPGQLCRPQSEEVHSSEPPPAAGNNKLLELPTATQIRKLHERQQAPSTSLPSPDPREIGERRFKLEPRTGASSRKLRQSYANVGEPVSNSDEPAWKNTTNETPLQTDTRRGEDREGKSWSHRWRKPGTGHRRPAIAPRPKQWHTNNTKMAANTPTVAPPNTPNPGLTRERRRVQLLDAEQTKQPTTPENSSPIQSKTPGHRI